MAEPRSVLVVDDNTVNRRIVVGHLQGLGHAADAAGDGFQALGQLGRRRYDAILMDLEMPAMDGFAAARIIREREAHAGRRAVIIALTARDPDEVRDRLRAAGIDDLLSKPVSAEQLAAALERWLGPRPGAGAAPPVDPPAPAVLEPRSMATLRSLGLLTSVLELFAVSLRRHVAALREAIAADDLHQVLRSAHSLRGAAAQIGARQLASACTDLEGLARGEPPGRDAERLRAAFEALEVCVGPLEAALQAELAVGDGP